MATKKRNTRSGKKPLKSGRTGTGKSSGKFLAKKKKAAPKKSAKKAAPKKSAKRAAKKAAPKKKSIAKRIGGGPKSVAKVAAPIAGSALKAAPKKKRTAAQDAELKALIENDTTETRRPEELGGSAEQMNLDTSEGVDDLAEELGESFVENITGADDAASEHREDTTDEQGGPFVITTGGQEFAEGTDESNPEDAEPAALPTTSKSQLN